MSKVEQNGPIISFGGAIKGQMEQAQGGPRKSIILDKDKISACYPMKLKVNFAHNGNNITLNQDLYYHFCQSLHEEFSKTEYKTFADKDNYENDERVIFVPDN